MAASDAQIQRSKQEALIAINAIRFKATGRRRLGIVWPVCPECNHQMSSPADVINISQVGRCVACSNSSPPIIGLGLRRAGP